MDNLIQNLAHADDSAELHQIRQNGLRAFENHGLPTAKTEAWKYTRLRDLRVDDYEFPPRLKADKVPELPFEAYVINIGNGYVSADLPNVAGVKIAPITEAVSYLGQNAAASKHPFVALNDYYLEHGLFITITGNLDKPLVLNYHIVPNGKNYFYNLRNVIVCESGSNVRLIERYTYDGEVKSRYLANIVNEIFVRSNAALQHYKYQNEAFKANHIAFSGVSVAKDGVYRSFCLQKGANIARNETEVVLNGEGAEAEVNAAYLMNGWATIDTTTNVYHYVPHTKSAQLVKGVVGGEAKGVFQGRIHIAPNAVCTSGTQLHKAILLSDDAEIDVKPELEIFADDVKCSHGAASGELDPEQLFYMQARGIGLEEARQILIDAYLNDVLDKISDEPVREWFKSLI